jgi:hypothetical protein
MRAFILGVVSTLLVLTGGVFAVSQFGLYPIGADNPPSADAAVDQPHPAR